MFFLSLEQFWQVHPCSIIGELTEICLKDSLV